MSRTNLLVAFVISTIALLAACTGPAPASSPTFAPTGAVTPVPLPTVPAATETASPAPSETPTPVPSPTATPAPRLRQLTTGGCCVQPFWSPDGRQVRYIDRPSAESPVGIYGVDLEGGMPALVTERLGLYSADGSLVAYPENGATMIERGGERWAAPSGGRPVSFSPDGTLIAWQLSASGGTNEARASEVWVARVDGSEARRVARLLGGGFSGWFPDGRRLLVTTRTDAGADPHYAALDLTDGSQTVIAEAPRLRGASISPEGGWLAYSVTFSGDPERDGLWVVRADGTDARRLSLFGAYRWRAEGQLLVIPLETSASSPRLVEVDASTGVARPLSDPTVTVFHIENGDWTLSPDGSHIAFVSADDRNIWILDLPGS